MHLNSAASQLRLRKWGAATKAASKVLDLEPVNVKALFRRAQAYREMEDYDLAEIDLKKAMEQEPNNRYGPLLHCLGIRTELEESCELFAETCEKVVCCLFQVRLSRKPLKEETLW